MDGGDESESLGSGIQRQMSKIDGELGPYAMG